MTHYRELYQSGKFEACEKECQQLLNSERRNPDIWFALCLSLLSQKKWGQAHAAGQDALKHLKLPPHESSVFHQFSGDATKGAGDLAEAKIHYIKASDLAPGRADAHYALADCLFALNEFDMCEKILDRVFRIGATLDDGYYAKALYIFSRLPGDTTVAAFFERYPTLKKDVDDPLFYFAIGNLLIRDKQFEISAKFFDTANLMLRSKEPYNFSRDLQVLELQKRHIAGVTRQEPGQFEPAVPRPVFIIGMPRTGSSLLEQMLGAHSKVKPLGEGDWLLGSILKEAKVTYGPKGIALFLESCRDEDFCRKVRDNFASAVGEDHEVVVDKTLLNFQFIELIRIIFPNALIVHSKREKGPCIWSAYRTNFTKGVRFSESLAEISRYYDEVEEVIGLWEEKLPEQMMRVQYEDLIADPEAMIRKVLGRAGLEFESACINPSEQSRVVNTASKVQVTQPIYKKPNKDFEPFRDLIEARLKELAQ